ncbi:hypothetical protein F5146DRAFT_1102783 [Armillaria mellea]|nr:hypothetical protein F5146DRAFT_1102783 [Armillaria mellea]
MAVCTFFLKGTCRFGENCRNEHPKNITGGFGNSSWNSAKPGASDPPSLPFTQESITKDLTANVDKPLWPLSSFGPAKHEPLLIKGLDESPEELRVQAFKALTSGNVNQYVQYESQKIGAAEQVYTNVRSNPLEAFKTAMTNSQTDGALAKIASGSASTSTSSVFGSTSTPSAFGQPASAFATTSAFGQPATPTSAFRQPATQPSAFGQTTAPTSAFSQPATQTSAFGQPSAFRQPASQTSAFGQPAAQSSAFGQPVPKPQTSAFGQPAQTSAFGQPAQSSAFGQTTQPTSAFGQTSYAGRGASSFGGGSSTGGGGGGSGGGFSAFASQPSSIAFGTPAAPTSAFGNPAPTTSAFGNNTRPSAFGTPYGTQQSAFGPVSTTAPVSAFAGSNPSPGGSFSQPPPSAFGPSQPQQSAFNPPTTTTTFPPAMSSHPSVSMSSAPDFGVKSSSLYKPGKSPYDQLLPQNYLEMVSEEAKEAFKAAKFQWGKVPDWIPPVELR